MSEAISARLISQEQILFEGSAESVVAPAVNGQLGILPRHAPLMAALGKGVLKILSGRQKTYYAVFGGFIQVKDNRLIMLVDKATSGADIDPAKAEEEVAVLRTKLQSGDTKGEEWKKLVKDLDVARVRLHAARLAHD
jgi:F-type H+-transporting ATPase subunit epsilon